MVRENTTVWDLSCPSCWSAISWKYLQFASRQLSLHLHWCCSLLLQHQHLGWYTQTAVGTWHQDELSGQEQHISGVFYMPPVVQGWEFVGGIWNWYTSVHNRALRHLPAHCRDQIVTPIEKLQGQTSEAPLPKPTYLDQPTHYEVEECNTWHVATQVGRPVTKPKLWLLVINIR